MMTISMAISDAKSSSRLARNRRLEILRQKFGPRSDRRRSRKSPNKAEEETPVRIQIQQEQQDQDVKEEVEQPFWVRYGVTSVRGKRVEMEDTFTVRSLSDSPTSELYYFAVYDGHGCSHVSKRCKERLHELVKDQIAKEDDWNLRMKLSFNRMDKEIDLWYDKVVENPNLQADCKCQLTKKDYDAVGSTAVVVLVTSDKIVVANCGDSRAILCRNGKPIPLSFDHKPDRADELDRIETAGGQVIYWDVARVVGVLSTSRAIGDNFLKPFVTSEPDVIVMDRSIDDEFIILASDGLWDVMPNEVACRAVRECLAKEKRLQIHECLIQTESIGGEIAETSVNTREMKKVLSKNKKVKKMLSKSGTEELKLLTKLALAEMLSKTCTEASKLLTKLALAQHTADNVTVVVVDLKTP